MKRLLILLAMVCIVTLHAQDQNQIDSLVKKLQQTKEDSNKVNLYLLLISGHLYFNTADGFQYEKPALELAGKLNLQQYIYRIKLNAGRLYWRLGKFNQAFVRHSYALKLAQKAGDKNYIQKILSALGHDYVDQRLYGQAIDYFTQSLHVAQELDNIEAIAQAYAMLSYTYSVQGNEPEAISCQYKALRIYEQEGKILEAAKALGDISSYQESIGNDSMALVLRNRAQSTILLILEKSNDKFDRLNFHHIVGGKFLNQRNFPEALKQFELMLKLCIEMKDIAFIADAYYNLGWVYETMGNDTEAIKNYLLASSNFEEISFKERAAELYIDIGRCNMRLKHYQEARRYFDKARDFAKEKGSRKVETKYYGQVELLDSALGNWENAYLNYKLFVRNYELIKNETNSSKITRISMQYDFDKQQVVAKAEQEKKDISERNQQNIYLAGGLGFLLIAVGLWSRLRYIRRTTAVIKQEKERSESLLLNILPLEVAEELKAKGSADAKLYDEVTVMFTDFKGFTQISENLTPSELVAELDNCFKAFDNIISRHNIEKIKTIGDSYMCAGGLPVPNKSHAEDVVNAALEIQKYMMEHLRRQKSEGKEPFELRIGIHTGPVVAGIVGVKKFSYDIWGDTVNIASKMQNSGEPGMVNISCSTFELVKDHFSFTPRGKIEAKNKGMIDMYFVESKTKKTKNG